jgi:hypothetical protein
MGKENMASTQVENRAVENANFWDDSRRGNEHTF